MANIYINHLRGNIVIEDEIYQEIIEDIEVVADKELKNLDNNINLYQLDKDNIVWVNADILIAYYTSLTGSSKDVFIQKLVDWLYMDDGYGKIPLATYTLVFLGYSEQIAWEEVIKYGIVRDFLNDTYFYIIDYMSYSTLTNFYKCINGNLSNKICEDLLNRRMNRVLGKINKINLEVNNDKKQLLTLVKHFGFDEKYNIAFTEIDEKFHGSNDKALVGSQEIGLMREIFKNFSIDIAKKIAQIKGESIKTYPDSTTEIGHARKYIDENFGLSSDEHHLLDGLKDILNNSGSHAITAKWKYFRLARNILIEVMLFLISKLEEFEEENKN